jgi:Fur family transcriptional regulator, ferric uptake regulator
VSQSTGDVLHQAISDAGLRVTTPRRAVWSVVSASDGHLTADEIAQQVREIEPDVNLSSVYRSLSLLADLGLVRESSIESGGPAYWELAHDDDHFHLRCRSCLSVEHHRGDTVEDVRRHLASDHGFLAEQIDLTVTGLCRSCAASATEPA